MNNVGAMALPGCVGDDDCADGAAAPHLHDHRLARYSPDLNPIEINRGLSRTYGVRPPLYAKLKPRIRRAAARTYDDLWQSVGHICELFTDEECYDFFKDAAYAAN